MMEVSNVQDWTLHLYFKLRSMHSTSTFLVLLSNFTKRRLNLKTTITFHDVIKAFKTKQIFIFDIVWLQKHDKLYFYWEHILSFLAMFPSLKNIGQIHRLNCKTEQKRHTHESILLFNLLKLKRIVLPWILFLGFT